MSASTSAHVRPDGRAPDELRQVSLSPRWIAAPDGCVLVQQGSTWVLCTVTVEARVPHWMRDTGRGWLTASYSMLPGSTSRRTRRDRSGAKGRTHEIERLIGRSLRAALDLEAIGERTFHVDCDVLQADGGTRTAAIAGGWVATALAAQALMDRGVLEANPVRRQVAAVSVGVVEGTPLLDLNYQEDLGASTDMNVVMTSTGKFVEVQGTAEGVPFGGAELDQMLGLAAIGIGQLIDIQKEALTGA